MNATLTLVMYWSISCALAAGGLYALNRGFALIVLENKNTNREKSTIEFFRLKASLESMGALTMVTAFMWAWAAALTLPDYKDAHVSISSRTKEIQINDNNLRTGSTNSINGQIIPKVIRIYGNFSKLITAETKRHSILDELDKDTREAIMEIDNSF